MEKRNSQLEHGLSMEQATVLLCTYDSVLGLTVDHNTSNTSGE